MAFSESCVSDVGGDGDGDIVGTHGDLPQPSAEVGGSLRTKKCYPARPEVSMLSRTKLFCLCVLLFAALPLAAVPTPPVAGWKRFDLPETGSYLWRYVPDGVDLSKPDFKGMPAVLFLHGSGGIPDRYRSFLF